MCVLCDANNLRLLVAPVASLSALDFAEAIRIAREAAMQYVLDAVDALRDSPSEVPSRVVDPEEYLRYVVERAEQDGVNVGSETNEWNASFSGEFVRDPRVQSFLSAAAEGLAMYTAQMDDQRTTLARYLEAPLSSVEFAGIGPFGEPCFRYEEHAYVVLAHEEAMQIATDRISRGLFQENPTLLLHYTDLPEGALDILSDAQRRPEDEANQVLAGMVDVTALAEDTVRQNGYGWIVSDEQSFDVLEQRFGDRMIVRFQPSESTFDDLAS